MTKEFKRFDEHIESGDIAVLKRPELAICIAQIASVWNDVEMWFGIIYTSMLLGREPAAFETFYDTFDLKPRQRMFDSAARVKLTPELKQEAYDLFEKAGKMSKERNKIVHGIWAVTESKPNVLLLCDARDFGNQINEVFSILDRAQKNQGVPFTESVPLCPDRYTEYARKDFDDILSRMGIFRGVITGFHYRVSSHVFSKNW